MNALHFDQAVFPPGPVEEVIMAAHEPSWVLVGPAGGNRVKYICTTCGTSVTIGYNQDLPTGKHS